MTPDGQPMHLADFMVSLFLPPQYHRPEKVHKFKQIVANVATQLGVLWEATESMPMWSKHGHIYLGTLMAKNSKRAMITGGLKRAIVYETRREEGVSNPRQILAGMRVARKVGPTQLFTLKKRNAARSQQRDGHADKANASRMESFQCFNYYGDCRIHGSFACVTNLPGAGRSWVNI